MKSTSDELFSACFSQPLKTQYGISAEFSCAMTAANKSARMRISREDAAVEPSFGEPTTVKSTVGAGSRCLSCSTALSVANKYSECSTSPTASRCKYVCARYAISSLRHCSGEIPQAFAKPNMSDE